MRRLIGVVVLVAGLAVVVALLTRQPQPGPSGPPASAPVPSNVTTTETTAEPSGTLQASPQSSAPKNGAALAEAWLRAYLTRDNRDDDRWQTPTAELSTPELLEQLKEAGPDPVGLDQLSQWHVTQVEPWHVTQVEPYDPIEPPADTDSRQLLIYAATVTDGTHTIEKPFELYAYRQDDGRWLIGAIDQPHSGEG